MSRHRTNTMDKEAIQKKNMLISISMSETREKRKSQQCRVYEIKIQTNKLNLIQKESLKMIFIEAKWIRNEMIGFGQDNNIFNYKLGNTVKVMNKDKEFENRELKYISAQQIQSVIDQVKKDIKSLNKLKNKGNKIGSLKFTSEVNSVDLKQYNITYKIKSSTKMKIQGIKGDVKVKGLDRIPKESEFANAKLIHKPDGYYIQLTTYINKNRIKREYIPDTEIGIDMGIKDNITLSNGKKYNVYVEETDRLKRLQKKLSRQKKGSNNRYKNRMLIRKEYQKLENKKNDATNKIVSEIKKYEFIYFQDENLNGWKNKKSLAHGSKKIQHSILGRVKSKLRNCDRAVMVDRYCATTQTCVCGRKNKHDLSERIYNCECGYKNDRDIHAAGMMIVFGKTIGMEHTEFKPVETYSAVGSFAADKTRSLIQEAQKSLTSG